MIDLPEEEVSLAQTSEEIEAGMKAEVPQRAFKQYDGSFTYLIAVRLKGNGISTVLTLLHKKRYTVDEVKGMCVEAAAVVFRTRIERRREELAKAKTPIKSSVQANEDYFESDSLFFEAVMMDKYDFRKLVTTESVDAELEATINELWDKQ